MAEAAKEFVCTYRHRGLEYGVNVHATDYQDASAHLRAIGTTGSVDGVLVMSVSLPSGAGIWRRLQVAVGVLLGRYSR
ncbi:MULTISPECIES: hypothetical protein [unclassified Shinella]|uniref:hypothetical protein n=1 Tax=unclassified Shinella TaxID=2643062 RepID=UPI00225D9A13|nr:MULTISPECIES: hypothetical protein [unclassified Shinella]MCO5139016.1 hypothetical protein [Shinella sp.]MDC7256255.1 hypothetical protein [Shinella sp. YE25]CAI0339112.1 hypothetical protein SHINE37_42966 [Rhizobiaceae bacterium]CAK7257527.1 protein of unknown function [Shinella sp. WSC3-e]